MRIYDENDALIEESVVNALIAEGKGTVLPYTKVTSIEPEHMEIMPGTDGLRRIVPEKRITESALRYHAYTEEEITERNRPTDLERVEAQVLYTAMMTGTVLEDTSNV